MPTQIIKPGRIDRKLTDCPASHYAWAVLIPLVGAILAIRRFYLHDISNGFGLLLTSLLTYAVLLIVIDLTLTA